ncbi:TetR/AcrR family transcriptional regulator [Silvibacterium sp.]|uniref:TetR/AcrR family transcriptional regulator n=1 Tax=Silvibacterium sp. TaxID=1964179 RepID=UPI0039E243B5
MKKKPQSEPKPATAAVREPSYHERVKGEKRRAAIDAAMEVFLEQGYERASLQQIAGRASVSTATLFKRFPTKAALFEAIVHDFWSEDAEIGRIPPVGDPKAGLRRIGMDFATLVRLPRMVAFTRLLIAEAPRFPELTQVMLETGKIPYILRVADYLKQERAAGRLKVEDPKRAARQFLAMIADQLFWPALLTAGFKVSDRDAKLAVDEALQTLLARHAAPARKAKA